MITTLTRSPTDLAQEKFSGTFLFFGIAMVVLGAIAATISFATTMGTVMLLGGIMVAAGIAESIHAFSARRRENTFLNVLSSLVYLGIGAMMLFNPLVGAMSLTLLGCTFLFTVGIIRLVHGVRHTEDRHWGWFVFGGIVDMALGTLIVMGWPVSALWVIGLFVGLEMMMYGFTTMALAMAIRDME
jgi:uncharacterized membrane protein HdeD (DUF308 family)